MFWASNLVDIYIKITLQRTDSGRKQAKFVQILGPEANFDFSMQGVGCNQWGATVNGWTTAINHRDALRAYLYWQPSVFGPKTREHIRRFIISRYLPGLVDDDAILRDKISSQLPGTGWYFGGIKLK